MEKVFQIYTLGCKVNQYNSEFIRENLLEKGWKEGEGGCVIINGCVVTGTAERKTRKRIYQAIRKGEKVIVTGCFARYRDDFSSAILLPEGEKVVRFLTGESPSRRQISQFPEHQRVWVKVQEGCPANCAYCIVPRVRGRIYSRPLEEVVEEVRQLEERYAEIVLTGTHLGIYGKEWGITLAELVERLLKNIRRARIRLSSVEIKEVDDKLLDLFSSPHLCPHLHLPLQSGSTRILRLMNRPYTKEEYLGRVEKIRKRVKDIALSTDIMIGFPFETEKDFQESVEMIRRVGFMRVHIFPYSLRPGSLAERFPPLPPRTVKEREKRMEEVVKDVTRKVKDAQIGRLKKVLIEGKEGGGYSEDYFWVKVKDRVSLGEIVPVRVICRKEDELFGEVDYGE